MLHISAPKILSDITAVFITRPLSRRSVSDIFDLAERISMIWLD